LKNLITPIGLALVALASPLKTNIQAGQTTQQNMDKPPTERIFLSEWWDGRYATGNWFGVRDTLGDRGVQFRANWRGNYLGIVGGGLQQRAGFSQEINFDLDIDTAKLMRVDALEGLSFTGNVRWREATYSINKYSGTDGTFRPDAYTGGAGWRFRKAYATYTSPELFGIENLLTISGGWQVPTDLFLVQPESKLFTNQTIRTAKGINPNLPWGGSFSTWGGYLRIEPVSWAYAQSGLYLAYPFGTDPLNHGLSFRGYAQDPSLNGVYSLNEIGFTPEIGPEKLPGKYSAGFIYWGVEQIGYDGIPYDGSFQFYWQADQRLTREKSVVARLPDSTGKGFVVENPKGDEQGLYWFSTVNFAPPVNNAMQFYVLGGFVYKGLLPGRDKDQAGLAFAYGEYSFDAASIDRSRNRNPRTYQAVLEFDYRFQVNRFAYVQPLIQYIINPGGRGLVNNDTIVGVHLGVNF
jgi:porin